MNDADLLQCIMLDEGRPPSPRRAIELVRQHRRLGYEAAMDLLRAWIRAGYLTVAVGSPSGGYKEILRIGDSKPRAQR